MAIVNVLFLLVTLVSANEQRNQCDGQACGTRSNSLVQRSVLLQRSVLVKEDDYDWELDDNETVARLEEAAEADDDAPMTVGSTTTTVTRASFLAVSTGGDVVCGGHSAPTCAECPQGHGAAWCNGDCSWKNQECILSPVVELTAENPYGCPEKENGQWPLGPCRARTASIHFNFQRPSGARSAMWYYNEVTATDASSATYYATNTHGYGYAGIQMSSRDPTQGDRVLCSTWDQSSGNAKMEKCGSGVACEGFDGEGTGAKALWYWRWTMGKRYAFLLRRADLPNNRVENACWFYAEELENEYPGGWKHIATTSTGKSWVGVTFRDAGSFLEQWTHDNSQELRRGAYGPAWYKDEDGTWEQSVKARFQSAYLQERIDKQQVRADYLSAGLDQAGKPYMMTGGVTLPSAAAFDNPRVLQQIPTSPAGVPTPVTGFDTNVQTLLWAGRVAGAQTPTTEATTTTTTTTPPPPPTPTPTPRPPPTQRRRRPTTTRRRRPTTTRRRRPTTTRRRRSSSVSCGNHRASSCAECPMGHGSSWCHGICEWSSNNCVTRR